MAAAVARRPSPSRAALPLPLLSCVVALIFLFSAATAFVAPPPAQHRGARASGRGSRRLVVAPGRQLPPWAGHRASATALRLSLSYPVLDDDEEEEDQEATRRKMAYTEEDRRHMRRALELAAKGLGKTRPNPAVGCVVLDAAGNVVGEGFHPKAGQPHAEVFALREAGEKARGGTAYVTLEPCNHHGRTPPCVDALLTAGVKKVVAGMVDPFPLVGGKGLERLASHGVEVVVGCEEDRCKEINRPFLHRVKHGVTPLGFLPLAYREHAFARPGREVLQLGEGPKVLRMVDAVVVMAGVEGDGLGMAALEEVEAAGDLQDSVVRVVACPELAALPAKEHPLWGREGVRRVVVTAKGQATADAPVAAMLRENGVEIADVLEEGVSALAVGKHLHEMGMLSALWLVGPCAAVKAVKAGVVQDIWVRVALQEADEIDGVDDADFISRHFGRPMKVSVMSCDAVGTQACVLSYQVDDEAEA